jgi:hypothetical protein
MAPRSLSVGRLEFEAVVPPADRKLGVIGCAPEIDPHWVLYHCGGPAARLVLLFDDLPHARKYVGKWIDSTYLRLEGHPPLKEFVHRQVHDLCVAPSVSIAKVAATSELLSWMHDVLDHRLADVPQEFAETKHDVVFLPNLHDPAADLGNEIPRDDAFRAGRLTLLRDSLCGTSITYENRRRFRFDA